MDRRFTQRAKANDSSKGEPRWRRDQVDRIVEGAGCVVFDFYKTLSSDLFFRSLAPAAMARIQGILWGKDPRPLNHWMTGQVKAADISTHLAPHLGMSAEYIESNLREGCRTLAMNQAVWTFAQAVRAAGKRTALVTVNMDVFSEEVAPALGLSEVFEVIVNSADHGTVDKTRLWPIAFDELGGGLGYADSFLIEDGVDSPAKFLAAGGKARQYVDDASFTEWLNAACE